MTDSDVIRSHSDLKVNDSTVNLLSLRKTVTGKPLPSRRKPARVPPEMTSPRARPAPHGGHITAVLGPTNTGKTHLAVERMLAHGSGMIGQPLRLLAREVYDRIRQRVHASEVALITGEEKIVPDRARYFVCTVESMPWEQDVDFMAVDEIQLCADPERGHIFTDRLLRARGGEETMFLGSETARPLISRLLPEAEITARPRFSQLTHAGHRKLTKLPRRSAIVAFSADQVYAIAELIRRQRGGAAVVMGALSPRTRNAQVALYQSGEVDFLVATDAIGMGLNMDVDHVAFAATNKFDGNRHRPLRTAELAQIAGRAGRYMNDGSFGTTGDALPLEPDTIERIEDHRFEADRVFQWRNPDLDFSTLKDLLRSLDVSPRRDGLTRAPMAVDMEAISILSRDADIQRVAAGPAAIALLWEVAQVPDFRKTLTSEHASLLARLYFSLMSDEGRISNDWLDSQISRLDRTDGDIDTLSHRIAHMRTWTFVANRSRWLDEADHWQARTRAIEDKLSDALHERLTQRFVDRRTSVLMKRLREREELMASINKDGEVLVEGEYVGRLEGFVFVQDPRAEGVHEKALRAASDKALAGEIIARAAKLAIAPASEISLTDQGRLVWQGHAVGRLVPGDNPLAPKIDVIASEQLNGQDRDKVQERLEAWLKVHIATVLEPLVKLRDAEDVAGLAKGVGFQLVEKLGHLRREWIAEDVRALDQTARGQLRKLGVRFGAYSIFMPALLKPAPANLILLLWTLSRDLKDKNDNPFDGLPTPPAPGLTSFNCDTSAPKGFYEALGFRVCGSRAVRLDMLERLADVIRPIISERRYRGGFIVDPDMMSLMGCSAEEMAGILKALNYQMAKESFSSDELEAARKLEAAAKAPKAIAATEPHRPAQESAANAPQETAPVETDEADKMEAAGEEAASGTAGDQAESAPAAETPEAAPAPAATETLDPSTATPAASAEAAEQPATEPAADTEAEAQSAADPATSDEPAELDIWRPQRRRHGNPRNQGKPQGKKGPRKQGKRRQDGPVRHSAGPKPKRDKPVDPDSPFAALMALKDQGKK